MKNQDRIRTLYMALIWLVIWGLASLVIGSDLILPGPFSTLKALIGLIVTGGFWLYILWTLIRVIFGIVISLTAGSFCAAIASRDRTLREFLRLPVSFFKSIPVMAIIIYVILIVKADWVAVVVCFLMCFPIAYTNILSGIMGRDRKLDELGTVLGLTGKQKWSMILRPELQPEIRASVNLITGMSWKVVVASEVLAIPEHSIGYEMLNSKYYLETPDLFAYIIVLILLSISLEKAASYLVEIDQKRAGRRVRAEAGRGENSCEGGSVTASLSSVSKSFVSEDGSVKDVLDSVSMEFCEGITGLLGPSGRGKTTVARLIMGLERPDKGTVTVEPEVRPDVLFQEDRLLPWLTAYENMLLALVGRKGSTSDVMRMAEKLELTDSLDRKPDELSGGMAHRVSLGRALLGKSRLLILDEPMRGLDQDLKERVLKNIEDDLKGRTVILISHDEGLTESLTGNVIRM